MQSRIQRRFRQMALPLALLLSSALPAQDRYPQFDLSLSALRDANGGDSYDISAMLTPSARWNVSVGGGSSSASDIAGSPKGNGWRAALDLHSSAFGVTPGYSNWQDSDDFRHSVPSLGAYWKRDGLRLELLAEWPAFQVDYLVRVLTVPVPRRFEFSGSGFGAGVQYQGMRWSGYARGLAYEYGSDIDRLRQAAQSPNLLQFPRLAALVGSMATLTQSALDSQLGAGIAYDFTRVSLHADAVQVTDAVTSGNAGSISAGALFMVNGHVSIDVTGGISSADGFEDAGYGALTFGLHW